MYREKMSFRLTFLLSLARKKLIEFIICHIHMRLCLFMVTLFENLLADTFIHTECLEHFKIHVHFNMNKTWIKLWCVFVPETFGRDARRKFGIIEYDLMPEGRMSVKGLNLNPSRQTYDYLHCERVLWIRINLNVMQFYTRP